MQINPISFKGVLVKNCSKEKALEEMSQFPGKEFYSSYNYEQKGDSVEISVPAKVMEQEIKKSPMLMASIGSNDIEKESVTMAKLTEVGLFQIFKEILGFECELTGDTAKNLPDEFNELI